MSSHSEAATHSPPPPLDASPVEEDRSEDVEIPLTMTASVVLTSLPKDARSALRDAGREQDGERKVTVHFRPIGSAPTLPPKQVKSTVSAHHPFSFVVRFLRRRLKLKETESVFCYLHNCWSPSLDESVGVLWNCFKTGEELVVSYAVHPAFG
ncbi:uncharacterized protein PV09_04524 [Verruconis gallopava]|uniref:Ubiquitin-like protein ATG12 n=1 Tax=Verruconis gallopava TaxID=253628 RepID=A0A0D1XNR3_9PEZI|nr:uncharacterized protein PV09_04524 [Verruconis gallopava]KIW04216.1 hypothetical protein PV09_04524 [Verruconis gallopava]